jgi:hypothetical protein
MGHKKQVPEKEMLSAFDIQIARVLLDGIAKRLGLGDPELVLGEERA